MKEIKKTNQDQITDKNVLIAENPFNKNGEIWKIYACSGSQNANIQRH